MKKALIQGAIEVPYTRRSTDSTAQWLGRAFATITHQFNIDPKRIDGLGVASFTLKPDRCVDMAWQLGLNLSWWMDDSNGGVSGLNMLQHAIAAIETGQARNIVLLAGDAFQAADFQDLVANYNQTTRHLLRPLGIANPNSLFALITQAHMKQYGLDRSDYGQMVIAQRRNATRNPNAVYRTDMDMQTYLAAPPVADPLVVFDCVPVVAGANAILISHVDEVSNQSGCVRIKAIKGSHNFDNHLGDGLTTGLSQIARDLFDQAKVQPSDIDLVNVYDDYPVMSLVQLQDLGFLRANDLRRFLVEDVAEQKIAINTSGGQLSVGQAGAAGGMHGLAEAIQQLSGTCGSRQIQNTKLALVSGYGMVQYRYGMSANAAILESMS